MLFDKITPEEAGIKSESLTRYINLIKRRELPMHSILMMKGDKIFCEWYFEPFNRETLQRMYSQTKSFVAIAIGFLQDEGKLNINDKICDYFTDIIEKEPDKYLKNQTIKDMLTMTTSAYVYGWFASDCLNRTSYYFNSERCDNRPSGTIWEYDSAGSQVLSSLVEKLSGKTTFDYLYEKLFSKLGTFNDATILKTRNGDSWGDSAMLCTARDIASFGRFVMNYGMWNGERLLSESYLREATSAQVSNRENARKYAFRHGYGYQIWRTERNGFAFVGMGNQLTVCLPDDDIIFVCTADCQGDDGAGREYLINNFFEIIMDDSSKNPLPKNEEKQKELDIATKDLKLVAVSGIDDPSFKNELNNVKYICEENPMGIEEFTFSFNGNEGALHYKNPQGEKTIEFGINHNKFGKFPQLGYSNENGGLRTTDGFMYDDAVSMAWLEERKLMIYVQIIDRYLGNATMVFTFKGNDAYARMIKTAEDFLNEYEGTLVAHKQ